MGIRIQVGAHLGEAGLRNGFLGLENAELLLVATRGSVPCPAPGTQLPYLIPRGEPSEKPEAFAEMIERHWPNTPKLEMFARKPRGRLGFLGQRGMTDRLTLTRALEGSGYRELGGRAHRPRSTTRIEAL